MIVNKTLTLDKIINDEKTPKAYRSYLYRRPNYKHPGFTTYLAQRKKFITGSSYYGSYNSIDINGYGTYIFPHGVKYEGYFKNGLFDGPGKLTYPNKMVFTTQFRNGELVRSSATMARNKVLVSMNNYLTEIDRSFPGELQQGFKAPPNETITIPKIRGDLTRNSEILCEGAPPIPISSLTAMSVELF